MLQRTEQYSLVQPDYTSLEKVVSQKYRPIFASTSKVKNHQGSAKCNTRLTFQACEPEQQDSHSKLSGRLNIERLQGAISEDEQGGRLVLKTQNHPHENGFSELAQTQMDKLTV